MATASFGKEFRLGRSQTSALKELINNKAPKVSYKESKYVKASECEALKRVFNK